MLQICSTSSWEGGAPSEENFSNAWSYVWPELNKGSVPIITGPHILCWPQASKLTFPPVAGATARYSQVLPPPVLLVLLSFIKHSSLHPCFYTHHEKCSPWLRLHTACGGGIPMDIWQLFCEEYYFTVQPILGTFDESPYLFPSPLWVELIKLIMIML